MKRESLPGDVTDTARRTTVGPPGHRHGVTSGVQRVARATANKAIGDSLQVSASVMGSRHAPQQHTGTAAARGQSRRTTSESLIAAHLGERMAISL